MYSSEGSDDYYLYQQNIGRREFIEGLILLGGLTLASYFLPGCLRITEPFADKSAAGRPNILLIFPDQHRGDYLHYMGHPSIITPNLDRLASESVSFTRCSTNSPLCMPARASLLTGQLVSEHGVWSNADLTANRRGPSHVRNIRDAGYHTAVVGKTHLYVHSGAIDTKNHVHELNDWGYTDTHELTGPRASANVDSPYTEYMAEEGLLDTHREYMSNYNAAIKDGTLRPWDDPPCPLPTEAHLDSYTGWQAVDWINNYKGDKPFYYQVCFPGPHDPYDSPAEYRARYKIEDMPFGISDPPQRPVSSLVQYFVTDYEKKYHIQSWTEEQRQQMKLAYCAKVSLIDHYIGEIISALEENGLRDNTWIIYTSDHGDMLSDRRLLQKMVFFEEAVNVPCIICPPSGVQGWKSDANIDHLDITATILEIAGAQQLADSEGRSLLAKILAGLDGASANEGKEVIFSEVYGFSMVRNERYKMAIDDASQRVVEFYDLLEDPKELRNLVNDSSIASIKRELFDRHMTRLLEHQDKNRLNQYLKKNGRL